MTDDFEKLVREMRKAQKEFFRTRSREALGKSKELEREVDKYLEERQLGGDLFDGDK